MQGGAQLLMKQHPALGGQRRQHAWCLQLRMSNRPVVVNTDARQSPLITQTCSCCGDIWGSAKTIPTADSHNNGCKPSDLVPLINMTRNNIIEVGMTV